MLTVPRKYPQMARWLLILAVALTCCVTASAQMPIRLRVRPQVAPDSADLAYYGKPRFWQAAGTVFGSNIALWAYDRFIQHGDFSYISLHSIKENFKHGFIWDNDRLGTNMFLHPYNGSLYYNAARSNGFNYWQSSLFALGGSAMWELFMEREYPSTNDIIATPIGGTAIGEVCYRMSDIILNDRTTGWERFGREAAAFVVSPMRGLTRIINGDAWRRRTTTGRQFGIPNIALEFSAGARELFIRRDGDNSSVGFSTQFNFEYGDRFEVSSTKPYDYFSVRADLNVVEAQPLLGQLEIKGRLLGKELIDTKKQHLSVGLYQHFDYYDSDTLHGTEAKCPYKLGVPASLGAGLLYRDVERNRWVFDGYLHANAVILGAILSDYYNVDERNYNLASGFSIKAGANFVFNRDKFSASASHEYYRLFTWKGYDRDINLHTVDYRTLNAQGDKSAASFFVTELRGDYRIFPKTYLTATFAHYRRSTRYRDYPTVRTSAIAMRLMLTYKF